MGGEGSGRRPGTETTIKKLLGVGQPVQEPDQSAQFVIPNYSGLKAGVKKTDGDQTQTDTLYIPEFMYGTDDTPPTASTVPIGTVYFKYTP